MKKIPDGPLHNALICQGKIKNKAIYFKPNSIEIAFTKKTFEELIKEQKQKKMPFVLAMAESMAIIKDQYKDTVNFYPAIQLNSWLKQTEKQNRYNSSQLEFRDPINIQPILDRIYYYTIDSLKDKFEYLGSDYDLYVNKKVNHFMATYFKVIQEKAKYLQNYIYLGSAYALGNSVAQNYEKAAFWYEKAAEKEDALAQYYLALLYDEGGFGITKDDNKAIFWCKKAELNGYVPARKWLKKNKIMN